MHRIHSANMYIVYCIRRSRDIVAIRWAGVAIRWAGVAIRWAGVAIVFLMGRLRFFEKILPDKV